MAIVADAGYSNGAQLAACEQAGMTVYVPVQRAIHQGGSALYPKQAFQYDRQQDRYVCPSGEILKRKQVLKKDRLVIYAVADNKRCEQCPQRAKCTPGSQRYLSRHFEEDVLNRVAGRTGAHPEMMTLRRCMVEHPFGTLKERILGNGRLLMRGLAGARTEISLAILAYNFKRVINIPGTAGTANLLKA
jgi:hypothetical protein